MGTVTPGSVADFAVLSASPWEVPNGKISDIDVTMTVSAGDIVFDSGD